MHIYFSGIGGMGLAPLALIARQAGYSVSGSDKQPSSYIDYLREHGVTDIHIGQDRDGIAAVHQRQPIDWLVYSSAVVMEQGQAPELNYCQQQGIRTSKRGQLLEHILSAHKMPMLAIAGTHGKTTTTAMAIWLLRQLSVPVSWSVGGKIPFGDMGHFEAGSSYFVYEADEYDHNFLAFRPRLSIITGIDWDHPDIFPTQEAYNDAFRQFISQSGHCVIWQDDLNTLGLAASKDYTVLSKNQDDISSGRLTLPGPVNRQDARQVLAAMNALGDIKTDTEALVANLNAFPGVTRRMEMLAPGLYTDYAHTPPKIRGSLETAREIAAGKLVVVYEGLHNTRQHFIKDQLAHLFDDVQHLYIVPSYLAREDPNLRLLTPDDLRALLSPAVRSVTDTAALDTQLRQTITAHLSAGDTVVCLSAGGGGSLDEWLRRNFAA